MDPNVALERLRALLRSIEGSDAMPLMQRLSLLLSRKGLLSPTFDKDLTLVADLKVLVDTCKDLDGWLSAGGCLPKAWQTKVDC